LTLSLVPLIGFFITDRLSDSDDPDFHALIESVIGR
jgi:hypothetical protein